MSIRVLVADDHQVVRSGIARLLEDSEVEIVGEATTGEDALRQATQLRPDVLLLDIRMPQLDGLNALARLKVDSPATSVLIFSSYDNPTYIARAVALGANGYLMKNATRDDLLTAIRTAATGGNIWSRDELRRVTGALATPRVPGDNEVPLTQRESEVLKQMAYGLTNREIAQSLGISYETVKEHVQHILRKIGVNDRTQAAVWAVRNGLV
ncbi:MAG: response regulator transcription factor [Pirellulales bacterium]|nr:response regulator transcription factor [Pirellulales bacterium]